VVGAEALSGKIGDPLAPSRNQTRGAILREIQHVAVKPRSAVSHSLLVEELEKQQRRRNIVTEVNSRLTPQLLCRAVQVVVVGAEVLVNRGRVLRVAGEAQSLENAAAKCVSRVTQNHSSLRHVVVRKEALQQVFTLLNERARLARLVPDVDDAIKIDLETVGLALQMLVNLLTVTDFGVGEGECGSLRGMRR
jgi:hypothetical protein